LPGYRGVVRSDEIRLSEPDPRRVAVSIACIRTVHARYWKLSLIYGAGEAFERAVVSYSRVRTGDEKVVIGSEIS
jgi:hypothetical protein